MLDHLLHAMLAVLGAIVGLVFGVLAAIEAALAGAMTALHVPANLQNVVAILAAVLVLLAALRLFGGFVRLVLIVFLLTLVAHAIGHHAFLPHKKDTATHV